MGIDLFYKVRAKRERDNEISVSEKGLLRHLRGSKSRETLKRSARDYLHMHPEASYIFASYVFDLIDGSQIAYWDRLTNQRLFY